MVRMHDQRRHKVTKEEARQEAPQISKANQRRRDVQAGVAVVGCKPAGDPDNPAWDLKDDSVDQENAEDRDAALEMKTRRWQLIAAVADVFERQSLAGWWMRRSWLSTRAARPSI